MVVEARPWDKRCRMEEQKTRVVPALLIAPLVALLLLLAAAAPASGAVEAKLDTGDPLHFVRPDDLGGVMLRLTNTGDQAASVNVGLSVRDRYGDEPQYADLGAVDVPAGGEAAVAVPPEMAAPDPAKPNGLRYAAWRLTPAAGGEATQGMARFAVFEPVGPTQGVDPSAFVFGIAGGSTEWFTDEMHEDMVDAMARIGVKCMRITFGWRRIQPEPDRWEWGEVDRLVDMHESRGMETQLLLAFGGAEWTKTPETLRQAIDAGNRQGQWRYPPREDAWRNMVRTVAQRYKGRIRLWEVWNEADLGFFRGTTAQYLDLLRWAHEELKAVDPENVVISTGLAGMNLPNQKDDIYRAILEHPETFDWYGYHRHGTFDWLVREVDAKTLPLMRETGTADKPLYFNETALKIPPEEEHKQDATLVKKLAFVWSRGSRGYHWFCPLMPDSFRNKAGWNYHLFYEDRTPRPGVLGYNTAARELRGREFVRQIERPGGQWALLWRGAGEFAGAGDADHELLFWNEDPLSPDRAFPVQAGAIAEAALVDLAGNVTPLTVRGGKVFVTMTDRPQFLRLGGVEGDINFGEPVVEPAERFLLAAGETAPATATLRNPLDVPQTVDVSWRPAAGLEAAGESGRTVELPPGGTAQVSLPVRWAGQPRDGTVALTCQFADFAEPVTLSIPVKPVRNIGTSAAAAGEPDFRLAESRFVENFNDADPERAALTWGGPDDLSADARIAYLPEARALQFVFDVTDDVHRQREQQPMLWKNDSIQFGLDFASQDGQWEFGLGRRDDDGRTMIQIGLMPAGADRGAVRKAMDLDVERAGEVTRYAAVVPLAALGVGEDDLRAGFGFTFVANDADTDAGREGYVRLTDGITGRKDPTQFERLRLARP